MAQTQHVLGQLPHAGTLVEDRRGQTQISYVTQQQQGGHLGPARQRHAALSPGPLGAARHQHQGGAASQGRAVEIAARAGLRTGRIRPGGAERQAQAHAMLGQRSADRGQ
jgi:hypothetical protein